MVENKIKITIRHRGGKPISVSEFDNLTWIKKLAIKWYGGVERLTVIVPDKDVKTLEIREGEESNAESRNANQGESVQPSEKSI